MKFEFLGLILLNLVTQLALAQSQDRCILEKITKSLSEGSLTLAIPSEITKGRLHSGRLDLNKEDGFDPHSVFVGIANHSSEGTHHYYLIAGNKRFDGFPFFKKGAKLRMKEGTVPMASSGVIFQLKADPAAVEKLQREMEKHEGMRSLTCLHAACSLLDASGIRLNLDESGRKRMSATVVASNLLTGHVVGKDGKIIETKLYATSNLELQHFLEVSQTAQEHVKKMAMKDLKDYGIIFTILGGGSGLAIWAMVEIIPQLVEKSANPTHSPVPDDQ